MTLVPNRRQAFNRTDVNTDQIYESIGAWWYPYASQNRVIRGLVNGLSPVTNILNDRWYLIKYRTFRELIFRITRKRIRPFHSLFEQP